MRYMKKYSHIELLKSAAVGYVSGTVVGAAEALAGSLAVPTSIRCMNDSLDENIDEMFHDKSFQNGAVRTVYDKVGNAANHYARLTTRLGSHGFVVYKMCEDVINGGDMSFGYLALPNVVSAGYEIYRFAKKRRR